MNNKPRIVTAYMVDARGAFIDFSDGPREFYELEIDHEIEDDCPIPAARDAQVQARPAPAVRERAKVLWETIKILGFQNEKFALQHIEAALSATPPAPAGVEVYAYRYSRNGGKTWAVMETNPTDIMPDEGGIVIPLVALLSATPPAPAQPAGEHADLMKFYSVDNLSALAEAQHRHIEKLQAKLPRNDQPAFTRVREG